jgi:hypothetical protein
MSYVFQLRDDPEAQQRLDAIATKFAGGGEVWGDLDDQYMAPESRKAKTATIATAAAIIAYVRTHRWFNSWRRSRKLAEELGDRYCPDTFDRVCHALSECCTVQQVPYA